MPPNIHLTLFISTVHISFLIALIRTNKIEGWHIIAILKDKAKYTTLGYNLAKHSLITITATTLKLGP